jgi:hypothetical protein
MPSLKQFVPKKETREKRDKEKWRSHFDKSLTPEKFARKGINLQNRPYARVCDTLDKFNESGLSLPSSEEKSDSFGPIQTYFNIIHTNVFSICTSTHQGQGTLQVLSL